MTSLAAEHLTIARGGRCLLQALSFTVKAGEALALTGPNGSGKSSLLRILAGLAAPIEGSVLYGTQPIATDPEQHGLRLVWVGHDNGLKAELTARENLELWLALRAPHLPARARAGKIAAAFLAQDLAALADRAVGALSYGQGRRVALLRLLLAGPEAPLWLLDEPAVGLDAAAEARFALEAQKHLAAGGMIVAATHHPLPFAVTTTLPLALHPPRTNAA